MEKTKLLLGTFFVLSSACGESISIEDLSANYASAFCDAFAKCVGPGIFGDRERCVTDRRDEFENGFLARYFAAEKKGTASYDEKRGGECIAGLKDFGVKHEFIGSCRRA